MAGNSELAIIQEKATIEALQKIDAQVKTNIETFITLKTEVDLVSNAFKTGLPKDFVNSSKELTSVLAQLSRIQKENDALQTKVNQTQKKTNTTTREASKETAVLREEKRLLNKEYKDQAVLTIQESGRLNASLNLYNKVQLKLNALTVKYNELALRKQLGLKLSDREEKSLVSLTARISKYDQTLKAVDSTIGKNQRKVGDYASAFNPLSNSINQLTREAPAFANSIQTGFMAISNNLPIFFDAMQNIIIQNKELQAQGKPTQSVFKQLASSLFSFQTLLSVGVTLLTIYGKDLVLWAKDALSASKSASDYKKNLEDLNTAKKEGLKSSANELVQLKTLYRVAQDVSLSTEQRMRAVRKLQDLYPSYFANMDAESIMLGRATKQYKELSGAIIASAQARAIEKILTDRMEKSLLAQEEQQNKINKALKEANDIRKSGQSQTQTVRDGQGGLIRKEISNQTVLAGKLYTVGVLRNGLKKLADDEAKANETLIKKQIELQNQAAKYESDKFGKDAPKTKTATSKTGLTKEQKDYLDTLMAIRDTEIAIAKERQLKGEIDEKKYWERYIQIIRTYKEKVSNFLNRSDSKQRKIEASVRRRAVEEIFKANKEIYDFEISQLESYYKIRSEVIDRRMTEINENEYDFESDKIKERNILYMEDIANTAKYYDDKIKTAIKYNQSTLQLEAERDKAVGDLQDKQLKNLTNQNKADQQKIEYFRELENYYRSASNVEEQRLVIANSKLNADEKDYALQKLIFSQNREKFALDLKQVEEDILKLETLEFTTLEQEKQLAILKERQSILTKGSTENDELEKLREIAEFTKKMQPASDFIKSSLNDLGFSNLADQYDETLKEILKGTFDWKDAMILAASAVADALTMVSERQKEKTIANLNEQLKLSQENTELELNFIQSRLDGLNAIQEKTAEQIQERNALEDEARTIREQQQQRERLIAEQKAKAEQRASAQQALINGALAATMTLAQLGIAGIIPAGIALAFGVAQSIAIMSRNPVPQYYTGTENASEGYAYTQERGREVITDKLGRIKSLGNNRGKQLTYMQDGDKVYNASETKDILSRFDKMPKVGMDLLGGSLMTNVNAPMVLNNFVDSKEIASLMGKEFERVTKRYEGSKIRTFERNGELFEQVGSKAPVCVGKVPKKTVVIKPKRSYKDFRS